MKTSLKAGVFAAVSLATLAPAAMADDDKPWGPVTAGAAITSDYRFRGISQTDRDAAFQGFIQLDFAEHFYFNVWASTLDFNDEAAHDASAEVDLTLGYNHSFSEKTSGGLKAIYYWYPGADAPPGVNEYDYFELMATLSHDFGAAVVSGELAWSPDYFFESGDSVWLKGGVSVPITDKFIFMDALSVSGNIAHQWIDENGTFGAPDYTTWDVGASIGWGIFTIDLRYVDTDISRSRCFVPPNDEFCEGGFVGTLSAALPG